MRIFCMETGAEWDIDADVRCENPGHEHVALAPQLALNAG